MVKQLLQGVAPFLLFLTAPFLCAADEAVKTVTIGYLTDLTGPGAYWGTQSLLGARIGAEELRRTDTLEVILKVDSHDMQTSRAVSAAQKLMLIDHIDAMYAEFSPTVIAISPSVQNQKLLLLYSAAAASVVRSNAHAYKSFLDYEVGCTLLAKYWQKQGVRRMGYLKINTEAGELCLGGVREVFPNLTQQDYDLGTDAATQVLALKAKQVDVIINAGLERDIGGMLNVLQRLNWSVPVCANEDALSDVNRRDHPEISGRAFVFGLKNPEPSFESMVRTKYPGETLHSLPAVALGYLHIKQLARAVASCPRKDLECQATGLAASRPEPELGFHGWKDRKAQLDIELKIVREGKLLPLPD